MAIMFFHFVFSALSFLCFFGFFFFQKAFYIYKKHVYMYVHMHVYLITFITVFYRLPGKSGANRAQTKQREQTFPQCLHRGATTVSTRREEQILGWYVTLEEGFGVGSGSCSSVFLFAEGCGRKMCCQAFAGGLNW